jgi:hypothetical protein
VCEVCGGIAKPNMSVCEDCLVDEILARYREECREGEGGELARFAARAGVRGPDATGGGSRRVGGDTRRTS